LGQGVQSGLDGSPIPLGPDILEASDLGFPHGKVVDLQDIHRIFRFPAVLVHPDDHVLAGVDPGLLVGGTGFHLHLGPAGFHGLGHAAHGFNFLDGGPGLVGHVLGQFFHHVGTSPGVHHIGDVGFFLDDQLGVPGDAGRKLRGQGDGLIQGIGMQGLGAAEDGRHGFNGGPHHVVVRILFGEGPTRGLAVGPQHHGLGLLRVELAHDAVPQHPTSAHLGNFQVEIHANGPEEGQAAREGIHVQPRIDPSTHIFQTIRQGESQFQSLGRPGFLDVVTGNGNGVELGHVRRRIFENIGDDAHGRLGRINVGIPHHELFQNVVLNGAGQFFLGNALLFRGHDVPRQNGQHGPVHGHGDGNFVQGDAIEEDLHVFDGVDGHPGLTHVPQHPGIIRVIAPVGGQVEGHGHPLTASGQGFAIKSVGFFRRGKTGVLADGPRTHRVHGGLGPPQIRRETRQGIGVRQGVRVLLRIQRLYRNPFRRHPIQVLHIPPRGFGGGGVPGVQIVGIENLRLIRHTNPSFFIYLPTLSGESGISVQHTTRSRLFILGKTLHFPDWSGTWPRLTSRIGNNTVSIIMYARLALSRGRL